MLSLKAIQAKKSFIIKTKCLCFKYYTDLPAWNTLSNPLKGLTAYIFKYKLKVDTSENTSWHKFLITTFSQRRNIGVYDIVGASEKKFTMI